MSHESHLGQRLSAFIDGELSHQQRERVLAHLAHCVPCRQEAAAIRTLKQRMHALGEATADTALTDRLIAVAGVAGPSPWGRRPRLAGRRPGMSRRHWPVRSIAVAGLTLAGLGVPAAAFLAGGGQQEAGPSVRPAIDTYMVQHNLSAGNALAAGSSPSRLPPAPATTQSASAQSAPTPSAVAPTQSAASSAFGALPAVGAAAASARAAAALTRVAAASTRAATAATGGTGRARRPRPLTTPTGVATPAGAR